MHPIARLWIGLSLCLVAGCRAGATHASLRPVETRQQLEFGYRAEWTEQGLGEAAPAARDAGGADATSPTRFHACVARVSEADLESLLGLDQAWLSAVEADAADLDLLLAELRRRPSAVLVEQDLDLGVASAAELRLSKTHAFISAFEVQRGLDAAIADPVIDVADTGFALRVEPAQEAADPRAGAGGTAGAFALELVLSELAEPARDHDVRVLGRGMPIALGRPMFLSHRLRVVSTGGAGRGVLIAGVPLPDGDDVLLAVVRPR